MSTTRINPKRRAGKMLERLKDVAFDATETIKPEALREEDGVTVLLNHLRDKFEPLEVLRVGRIVDDFVYDFERADSEEIQI